MGNDSSPPHDSLPFSAKMRIDEACLAFEDAWQSQEQPRIEEYLGDFDEPERTGLLRELLLLDVDYRSKAGQQPTPDDYHGRFPNDAKLVRDVFRRSLDPSGRDLPVGTKIRYFGDYELIEVIARGGMGVVYRARQVSLDRVVALKLILAGQFASDEEVERFRREAQAAASLQHANIVAIHEVGEHDGQQYLSMAYVDGQSLAEIIRERPLPAVRAARYVRTVARAVEYAHRQGTLHRDLKPANILIDGDDQPRITDFGLARRVDAGSDLTKSGQILGSPSYMPPEQASGKSGAVGPCSDVYSLGAILYDLVTGRPPFKAATTTDTLLHVVQSEPVSPRTLNPKVPRDLETICLKCLEKEPQRRYRSAGELSEELGRFLAGEPIQARPVSLPGRIWRWCRRNPTVSTLAAGLLVAVLTGLIGISLTARNEYRQRRKAEQAADQNRRLLYVADMNVAQQAWDAGNIKHAVDLLERYRPKPGEGAKDLRGFQWHYLWRRCQRVPNTTILPHGDHVWGIAFSPDGKTLATAACENPVRLWDVETGVPSKTLGKPGYHVSVAISSDGRTLAAGTSIDRTLTVFDLATGEVQSTVPIANAIFALEFSPTNGSILALADGFEVRLWDVAKGKLLQSHHRHSSLFVWDVTFSPDGKWVASANNRELILWNVETGQTHVLKNDLACGYSVAFSPDGKTLVAGGFGGKIWRWDVDRLQPMEPLQGQVRGGIWSLAFSSDGRLAASFSNGTVSLWDVNTGTEYEVLKGHQGGVLALAFSPDNRFVASGSLDGDVRLWDVTVRAPPDVLRGHALDVSAVAFVPDGSALVSSSFDGTVRAWDVQTGEELGILATHHDRIMTVAVSPDGSVLASGGWDFSIKLRNLATGQPMAPWGRWCNYGLAFSPDGRTLAACGASPSAVVRDMTGNGTYHTASGYASSHGHRNNVVTVAISPDGKILATGSWDKRVMLWNHDTGRWLRTLDGHQGAVHCVAFSPDGRQLASGSTDSTVRLWDVATGQPREVFEAHSASVNSVAFSPDGTILAAGSNDQTVTLWYLGKDREPESLATGAAVTSVAFSPDGDTLAAGSGNTVRLWRTAGGEGSKELNLLADLEVAARTIAEAQRHEQQRILEEIQAYLATRIAAGLRQRDIILAAFTAGRLRDADYPELAAEALRGFASVLLQSDGKKLRRLAEQWQGAAR